MRLLVILAVVLMAVPSFASSGNWLVNGDFENGMTGWTYVTSPVFGGGTIAPQLFSTAGGVKLTAYNGSQSGATANLLTPKAGTSVGWAREGAPASGNVAWSYIYQTLTVPAGTYNIDQTKCKWDVIALSANTNTTRYTGMLLVRVDGQIGSVYSGGTVPGAQGALRASKWDQQANQNAWTVKQIANGGAASFTTTTGQVQIVIAFEDHAGETLNATSYGAAAFDNIVFETAEAIPEPSSLLALGAGLLGLAGFVVRRRK